MAGLKRAQGREQGAEDLMQAAEVIQELADNDITKPNRITCPHCHKPLTDPLTG